MLTAMLHLVAAALVISGLDKLRSPTPSTAALRAAGVPVAALGDRLPGAIVGMAEISIGAYAVATGSTPAAAAVAATYLSFAWFLRRLSKRDSGAGCGCFGASSAPPGPAHVLTDLAAASAAAAAAFVGAEPLSEVLTASTAVPYFALLVVGGTLLLMGPALSAELRHVRSGSETQTFRLNPEATARY